MNGCRFALTIVTLPLLLVACVKAPRFEPPVAKTNPQPTQRYEITVELIDPPADIRSLAGEAHFGVGTRACLPYRDRIARVTVGASYNKGFALAPIGNNTYRGHIFLDWPVDEDYYGLGTCKWIVSGVDAVVTRSNGLIQVANMNRREVPSESENLSYCREVMRDKYDKICFTPIDEKLIRELDAVSYRVKMSSRKD